MANYQSLKAAIQDVIKTNGNNEITGTLLQQSLLSMINSLGVGFQFMGVATPETNPGTPDQNVVYFAATAGTYSNFGGIVLYENEACFLCWNGAWSKKISGAATTEETDKLESDVAHCVRNYGEKILSLNVENDNVELTVSPIAATLDSIAYENLTYREIFEQNNFLGISPGFEDGSISPLVVSAGNPTLQSVEFDSGQYALDCSGTTSQQLRDTTSTNHPAFTAARVKITSWTSGFAGIQYGTGTNGGINRVTNGWETIVAERYYTSNTNAFVGSFSSANLTGYVDMPVVILKSIFNVAPTLVEFQALYNTYCELKRLESERQLRTYRLLTYPETPYDANSCKAAFVQKMNEKAAQIGATSAIFMDASGLVYSGSQATAMDMLRILIHAAGIRGIAEKWNCKSR